MQTTRTADRARRALSNNPTPATLLAIRQALRKAGFDPGRDDGGVDSKRMSSVRAFQTARGLPVDGGRYINMATVKSLGVPP